MGGPSRPRTPEQKERINARERFRRANDPAFREREAKRNRDGQRARRMRLREDPEKLEAHRKRHREWARQNYKKNPRKRKPLTQDDIRKARDRYLRWSFGISLDQREEILRCQGSVCALCREVPTPRKDGKSWHTDHDHVTGRVRGVLCVSCNLSLGIYERFRSRIGIASIERYIVGDGPTPTAHADESRKAM